MIKKGRASPEIGDLPSIKNTAEEEIWEWEVEEAQILPEKTSKIDVPWVLFHGCYKWAALPIATKIGKAFLIKRTNQHSSFKRILHWPLPSGEVVQRKAKLGQRADTSPSCWSCHPSKVLSSWRNRERILTPWEFKSCVRHWTLGRYDSKMKLSINGRYGCQFLQALWSNLHNLCILRILNLSFYMPTKIRKFGFSLWA